MLKYICVLILIQIFTISEAQDSLRLDSTFHLNEILITYQAETSTPITYQNILSKTLKNKSTGQEPSFFPPLTVRGRTWWYDRSPASCFL